MERKLARVIDANLNRAREGLRVCEDICRFLYDLKGATEGYKKIRHRLTGVAKDIGAEKIVCARDSRRDVGRPTLSEETPRRDVHDIFYANSQRVKESIRVLEECAKILDVKVAEDLKELRYRVYEIEQQAVLNNKRKSK